MTYDNNNPLSTMILKEFESNIERAIEALPTQCRKVFDLAVKGFSYQGIAEKLCISVIAVGVQINRARTKIQKSVQNICFMEM